MVELREDGLARSIELSEPSGTSPYRESGYPEQERADHGPQRSLIDDIEALVEDARTYLGAELTYQKTRASFVGDRLKKTIVYGGGAAVLGLVALIGLTVGLIIALTPLITGWGATAVVVGLELVVVFMLLKRAARNWNSMMGAVRSDDPDATPAGGEA
jgi:hypothetical protein